MLASTRRARSADDDPPYVRSRLESLFRPRSPDPDDRSTLRDRPARDDRPAAPDVDAARGAPAGVDRADGWLARSVPALPGRWRTSRIDPGRLGVLALLAIALAVAGLVGVLLWRARPTAEPVPLPSGRRPGPTRPDPAATATPVGTMVVAVAGRVRHPGIVTLTRGSRVVDAIRAAGGLAPGADLGLLNLARPLGDGEQVVVGVPVPVPVPGTEAPAGSAVRGGSGVRGGVSGGLVNLNAATAEELVALPGIGPVTAQRIVDWRAAHGRFTSVDELRQVSGIGPAKLAQVRDRVTV